MSPDDSVKPNKDDTAIAQTMTLLETVFQDCINDKTTCTCFLNNGIKLVGKVQFYDAESILYQGPGNQKPFVIMRSSIATFLPYVDSNMGKKEEGHGRTGYGRT